LLADIILVKKMENNVLNKVLLLMNYDTTKTLKENSQLIEGEFSKQLSEQKGRIGVKPKPKPNLTAAKNVRSATINKYKTQHQLNPKGLTPKQRNAFGQELLKNEVSVYANTKLPNGKYPTPKQQQKYADDLVNSGKIQKDINTYAPSATPSKATKTGGQSQKGGSQSQNVTVNVTTGGGVKPVKTSTGKTKKLNGGGGKKPNTPTVTPTSSLGQKIINMAKQGWSWRKIVWTAAKLGIGAYAIWWLFFSDKESTPPDDIPETPPEDTTPTQTKWKTDCTIYSIGCKTDVTGAIGQVQECLGLVVDGKYGPKTETKLQELGYNSFTDADIEMICNRQSSGGDNTQPDTNNTTGSNLEDIDIVDPRDLN
jgi:hypothetical protein